MLPFLCSKSWDALAIEAAEAAVHAHYPMCGVFLLLVELDGPCDEVDARMREVREISSRNGATEICVAQSDAERALIWKGRKAAFAAMGRISPTDIVQDGVIPRTALPRVLTEIERMSSAANFCVATSFMQVTATCIRSCSTIAPSPARKRSRSIFRIAFSISASTAAAPSPAIRRGQREAAGARLHVR